MKRTFLKFCSLALALVMTLATFAGTFTFTATATEPVKPNPTENWSVKFTEVAAADGGADPYAWFTSGFATAFPDADPAVTLDNITASQINSYILNKTFTIDKNYELVALALLVEKYSEKEINSAGGDAAYAPADWVDTDGTTKIGFMGKTTIKITADLDMSAYIWDKAIGATNSTSFFGTIIGDKGEGAAPTITGLYNMATTGNFGFVGTQARGYVSNLNFDNCHFKSTANTQGIVVGYTKNDSSVARPYSNLKVTNSSINTSGQQLGGVIGYANVNNATYTNLSFQGTVTTSYQGKLSTPTVTVNNGEVTAITRAYAGSSDANVGGICGKTEKATTFQNCAFDGDIIMAGKYQMKSIAGISGWVTSAGVIFDGCTVEGSISGTAEFYSNIGGIVGYYQGAADNGTDADLKDCVVTIDITLESIVDNDLVKSELVGAYKTAAGTDDDAAAHAALSAFMKKSYAQWVKDNYAKDGTGIAGLVADANGANALVLENCYYGGTITTDYNRRVGGMVGYNQNATISSITFTNCQMDGIVNGSNTQVGAYIGRVTNNKTSPTAPVVINFRNCLLTGMSQQNYGPSRNNGWIGSAATNGADVTSYGEINFSGCYSAADVPFIASNDVAAALRFNLNAGEFIISDVQDEFHAYAAAPIAEATALDANVWTTSASAAPILKIAAEVATDRPCAGVDLSWFDPANYIAGFTITTDEQYLGLALLSHLNKYSTVAYNYVIADSVNTAAYAEKFADGFLTAIDPFIVDGHAEAGDLTLKVQVPTTDNKESESTKLRLVSAIDAADIEKYSEVGFVITMDGKTIWLDTTTVFATINGTANGMACEYTAEDFDKTVEDYLFTQVITDIPNSAYKTGLTIRVYAVETDSDVIMGNVYYNVTLNSLLPDAPVEE